MDIGQKEGTTTATTNTIKNLCLALSHEANTNNWQITI